MYAQHVDRRLDELHSHPSYVRNRLAVSTVQLSRLEELGELAFQNPVLITPDGTVLDGYARVKLAKLKERPRLTCIVYELNETQALQFLLQEHQQMNAWNPFIRTSLALDLEPELREAARSRQSMGGQHKGLANLPEAEKLHVRSGIARAAGVCPRNVDKVKHLIAHGIPELLQALRNGEVRIHRAWKWSKQLPESQQEALWRFKSEKGIKKTIRNLVSQAQSKISAAETGSHDFSQLVRAFQSGELGSVKVIPVNVPGKAVFVTKELFCALEAQERLEL